MVNRREFLSVLSAPLFLNATSADAHDEPPLFASGLLAGNPVAASFRRVDASIRPPSIDLASDDGIHRFPELTGKVRIISLWAEWCVPCLIEARDLSELRQHFSGPRFDILGILTAGRADLTPDGARTALARVDARDLPTWVELANGRQIGEALATDNPPHISLPCNLLVDATGRIRGRSIGDGWNPQRQSGRSHWGTTEAREFIKALRNGALSAV